MTDPIHDDVAAIAKIGVIDRILEVICRTTGIGFSAVVRVTNKRWVACAVRDEISFGLKAGSELPIDTTICREILQHGKAITVDDVTLDPDFCDHPTPKMYGFQSCVFVPIRMPDGAFFGTLCAFGPGAAKVRRSEIVDMFTLFAELIATHLDTQRRVQASEAALAAERETAQFREQFMAVLGHDLRNPLGAIKSGADLLAMTPQSGEGAAVVSIIQRSASRMAGLIDNVLDFARGRLGGGLSMKLEPNANLDGTIKQVVAELQTVWPACAFRLEISLQKPIDCDRARIGQMLSNLLANALTHGDPNQPICVTARTNCDHFELAVKNCGETIPAHIVEHLFKPFARGSAAPGQQGLGLGLYIATEIARAHEGELGVTSADGETCFTFKMPLAARAAAATN